ncbi:MAG: proteasome assembly chaperone family protein [Nanobdellota archaeon]
MKLILNEKPKKVKIIQGFPGFGMVGSIATEYLRDHLKMREIGRIVVENQNPLIAIHEGKIIPPVGIYYHEDYNLIVISSLTKATDNGIEFAEKIKEIASELEAEEIISLEGVAGSSDKQHVLFYSNSEEKKQDLVNKEFNELKESVIIGVSAALMMDDSHPMTSFFALTASTLPDSSAAAEIIKSLDNYLGLSVDYNPLYEQAKVFEQKIKGILANSEKAKNESEKSMLNYFS